MQRKDLQLCGLGNGLVDIQVKISDEELGNIKANRGEMCLVDSLRHKEILSLLGTREQYKCSGGSAANTVIAYTQMGGRAAYKTVLGDDDFGRFYASEFTDLKIELRSPMLVEEPTGVCLVLITPDSERTMLTSLAATAKFTKDHIDEDIIRRSEWLYIEGYRFSVPEGAEAVDYAIEKAKKYDTKIAVTFSDVFIVNLFRDKLEKTVNNADLIFCNEQEAMAYTGADNSQEAFKLLGDKVPNVVVTLGEKGSMIKWDGEIHSIPVYEASPVDATGAGDMFAAGFFFGINKWNDPVKAGHLASLAGAKIVSQLGARYSGNIGELIDEIEKNLG